MLRGDLWCAKGDSDVPQGWLHESPGLSQVWADKRAYDGRDVPDAASPVPLCWVAPSDFE
jgi:hypothetical protein